MTLPRFTLDGFPLHRPGLSLFGFRTGSERGWYAAPPARPTVTDRDGAHGGVDGPTWRGPRVVSLSGTAVFADTRSGMADVERFLGLDPAPGELVCEDALRVLRARVRLAVEPAVQWLSDDTCSWSLAVVAPDHRKYGPEATASVGLPSDASGGASFGLPGLSFPGPGAAFGDAPSIGMVQVANPGTAPADPVIRLRGRTSGLTGPIEVLEWRTGRRLRYDGDVLPGQTVTLDARARSVLVDAATNRRELLTLAQWWSVPPGGVVPVSWSHSGGPAPDARLEVAVSPAYL